MPGGELQLQWVLLAAAIAGAMLGDGSAFWIGHRSQREILCAWPLTNYPRVVEESEAFFNRWGTLAVFFARFVPPIRAFVPITAGALGMPPSQFYRGQLLRDPALGARACAAGRAGGLMLDHFGGLPASRRQRQASCGCRSVIGGAHHRRLAVWTIRRRNGGGVIEPAPQRVKDLR